MQLLRQIASKKGIELLECAVVIDHVHLLLRVEPPRLAEAVRILKGASSYQMFRRLPELKLDANTNSFWQSRYAAKAVEPAAASSVRGYIKTQGERLEKFDRP